MTVLWVAVLLVYGVSPGLTMDHGPYKPSNNKPGKSILKPGPSINKPGPSINKPGPSINKPGPSNNAPLPLDMAPNSVDDMYDGCRDEMAKVVTKYLENELNKDPELKKAWATAESKYKQKKPPAVGREQIIAIYIYTFVQGSIYRDINAAVRTQGPQYKTSFNYHAIHFLLTDAIQFRNARQQEPGECVTVYRRVNEYFVTDVVNKQIRFGSFTSTSRGRYPKADYFGTKSCFEIITCMGGDFSIYSKFENEAEVVIPPYEVFKVQEVLQRSEEPDLPCEVVYKMKSTGPPVSNLNCALFEN